MPAAYRIEKYNSTHKAQWDACVAASKNGTFLHYRDFMEYHSDRFQDYSLVVYGGDNVVAVLPGNKIGNIVHSHQGLTYGGLIYGPKMRLAAVIMILREILKFLNDDGITQLNLKSIPVIYHKQPAQEAEYALFTAGAKLSRRDSLFVYDYDGKPIRNNLRKRGVKCGSASGLKIAEENALALFWDKILIPNLGARHNVQPVHTAAEIEMLQSKFPENIRQFNVYHNGEIVAGSTVFVTSTAAHLQYISGNGDKNKLGSLDFLHDYLISAFSDKKYFDFGTSNENNGMMLNEGLAFWKEGFGARTIIQDFYEVDTANYGLLDNVLI